MVFLLLAERIRHNAGSHQRWLVWVIANHLHGITRREGLDPSLILQCAGNRTTIPRLPSGR